jgi:hypothetical protein
MLTTLSDILDQEGMELVKAGWSMTDDPLGSWDGSVAITVQALAHMPRTRLPLDGRTYAWSIHDQDPHQRFWMIGRRISDHEHEVVLWNGHAGCVMHRTSVFPDPTPFRDALVHMRAGTPENPAAIFLAGPCRISVYEKTWQVSDDDCIMGPILPG